MRKFFVFFISILSLSSSLAYAKAEKYQYQIAACLIFQNEADYLREWLEYHKLIGIEHFYLFDNLSTDHYMRVLKPYLKSGEVELFHEPTVAHNQKEIKQVQCRCYEKSCALAAGTAKWLAIIDADEFIVPLKTNSLLKLLNKYDSFGGLYINWLMFGTSHVKTIPKDCLMIELLTHCAEKPMNLGKSIVRPERVSHCTDPHRSWYHAPYDHVNTDFKTFKWVAPIADDKILIFHYNTRDLDHLIHVKYPRRQKWQEEIKRLDLEHYIQSLEHQNARENHTMQRFVPKLRAILGLPLLQTNACSCKRL